MSHHDAEDGTAPGVQESEGSAGAELRNWTEAFSSESQVRIDRSVDEGRTVLRFHLPDVDPDRDVELVVAGGMLRLRGVLHDPPAHRAEIRHGAFEEWLQLPPGVTADEVRATFVNGVLQVDLPPGEPSLPERVRIERPSTLSKR